MTTSTEGGHEPAHERLKTADMCEDITARLLTSQRDDPPLYPELVQKTLRELDRLATADVDALRPLVGSGWGSEEASYYRDHMQAWARWLLEQLHHRAVSGVEWDEPREPAWSLDPDPRPYERVLDESERHD